MLYHKDGLKRPCIFGILRTVIERVGYGYPLYAPQLIVFKSLITRSFVDKTSIVCVQLFSDWSRLQRIVQP